MRRPVQQSRDLRHEYLLRGVRVRVSLFYAHRDERLREELEKHLAPLRRSDLIAVWHDRCLTSGSLFDHEILTQLNTADIVLLLISPDFMASDYCYQREMQIALRRHRRGDATVIPIILRPVDWRSTPIGQLLALPKDAKPVTSWAQRDEAFLDVARGIRRAVEEISQRKLDRP